ncbi:formin-like protein 3 [Trifolium pratense]|uniref:formin-like protein 3 n=1 Tax=Trifolium pratense TaxID=57577 RepID=UPI001E6961CD|nr:formin-like protein 3 [Trifolium pratense]
MVGCAAEFIRIVTSKANYYCQLEQRDTITAEDLIDAMRKMRLDVIADYSSRYNQHYHNFHASVSGQYAPPPPPPLPQDVQACVSGEYYAPPPPPLLPQDVQARVSGQYYAPPPPPPLSLQDVQARNFSMAPNSKFPNPIEMSTFFGVDDEVLPSPLLPQNVQAVSGQYYAPSISPLPSQDVQAPNFFMAPNFKFPNPIEMGTFFGGDDSEELPPPLLSQDVQTYVGGQCAPPPPPPQDDQARYFPMASNFKFPNPIEMGSFFGYDDGEELPPPPPPQQLPRDVQARVRGQYAPPPPPLDVQACYFPKPPNFKFPNPIEIGAYFGDDGGEELPPPPPQDVQASVSGQYAPPPPPLLPQDVQAHDFSMAPNFMFREPTEMGSLFGDGYGEELDGGGGGGGGGGDGNSEGFDLIAFLNSYDK